MIMTWKLATFMFASATAIVVSVETQWSLENRVIAAQFNVSTDCQSSTTYRQKYSKQNKNNETGMLFHVFGNPILTCQPVCLRHGDHLLFSFGSIILSTQKQAYTSNETHMTSIFATPKRIQQNVCHSIGHINHLFVKVYPTNTKSISNIIVHFGKKL